VGEIELHLGPSVRTYPFSVSVSLLFIDRDTVGKNLMTNGNRTSFSNEHQNS